MAKQTTDRVKLTGPLQIELPDGSTVEVRPGPYKKGLAVVPVSDNTGTPQVRGRGRKPRPGTVKLRAKLERDAKADRLQEPTFYFRWLLKEDETISQAVARQVVYRELRSIREDLD